MEQESTPLGSELKTISDSFTPVRRKESTLNHGRLSRDVEKEWTAARCNRLLRPLTSRIAILRKSKQIPLNCLKVQSKKGRSVSDSNMEASGEETANNNASWVRRKRVKRTYSGKTCAKGSGQTNTESSYRLSSSGRSSLVPGEILVPTPLLNRAWRKTDSPYRAVPYRGVTLGHCQQTTSDGPTKARLLGISKALQALCQIRRTRSSIYEGIYNGLEALLRATRPNGPKKGPKSLLSLCLTTVPKYVIREEKILSGEIEREGSHSAIEKRDISTEIYDELELLGSGRGWTHLQSVVRAHGVQIICDAISEGLLECNFGEILFNLCTYTDNFDEAELILSSLLPVWKLPFPPARGSYGDFHLPAPLPWVQEFTEITGRTGFEYRQFSVLIQNGNLPPPWLATPAFTPIWTVLIQDLSLDHARADATTFMVAALQCLLEYVSLSDSSDDDNYYDDDFYVKCRSTLLSVLTTISSIILLSRDGVVGDTLEQESKYTSTIRDTHSKLLKDCVKIIRRDVKKTDLRSTVLLLACVVTEPNLDDMSDFIIDPLYQMYAEDNGDPSATKPLSTSPIPSTYDEAVVFLSSVARCCGKGASTSGFEYLQYVHRKLKEVSMGRGSSARTVWNGIVVDSAFAFAQATPGQKYLDYADSLDTELHTGSSKRPGSVTKEHPSITFRWEDGISSWVTKTPAANISKTKSLTTNFESDEVDFESPSIARSQRHVRSPNLNMPGGFNFPNGFNVSTKRKCDSAEYDQSTAQEMQLPSRPEWEIRRGKAASFNIWHHASSDDELNSSYESFENTRVLKDLQNAATRRRSKSKLVKTQRQKENSTINRKQSLSSEDELGI